MREDPSNNLADELRAVEQQLGLYHALPLSINRELLLFEAGYAAAESGMATSAQQLWLRVLCPAIAGAMTITSAALLFALLAGTANLDQRDQASVRAHDVADGQTEVRVTTARGFEEPSLIRDQHYRPPRRYAPRLICEGRGYLALRTICLERGVEACLTPSFGRDTSVLPHSPPTTSRRLLRRLLPPDAHGDVKDTDSRKWLDYPGNGDPHENLS